MMPASAILLLPCECCCLSQLRYHEYGYCDHNDDDTDAASCRTAAVAAATPATGAITSAAVAKNENGLRSRELKCWRAEK